MTTVLFVPRELDLRCRRYLEAKALYRSTAPRDPLFVQRLGELDRARGGLAFALGVHSVSYHDCDGVRFTRLGPDDFRAERVVARPMSGRAMDLAERRQADRRRLSEAKKIAESGCAAG